MGSPALASFGSGVLIGQSQSVSGLAPVKFGVLQECDFDFSFTTKELMGTNQFPVFVARGQAKWTMKAKVGVMSGLLMNSIFFNQTLSAGQVALQLSQASAVPASTPWEVTPTVPNSGTWIADQGVINAVTGLPMTPVATSPTAGEYTVAAGVYTFATADAGTALLISYTYSFTTAGQQVAISNQPLGDTPYFSGVFRNRDAKTGLYNTFVINRMSSSKLSLSSKTSDFSIPEFDADIYADDNDQIGVMSFGDKS